MAHRYRPSEEAGRPFTKSDPQVLFGNVAARVTSQSSNAVTVLVPEGNPGPVSVVVTNRDGTYAVAGAAYSYLARG